MGVGDDELDAGQASRPQAPQERHPRGAVFARGDVDPEHLPAPFRVHRGGDGGDHVDDASALTTLDHERVDPQVGVGALVQGPASELLDNLVEARGEGAHL